MRSLKDSLRSHVHSVKSGFSLPIITSNQLIFSCAEHGLIDEAQKLFDEMPERNAFSWNTIISAHIKSRNLTQAKAMFDAADVRDLVTYNSMLSGYVGADGHEGHAVDLFVEMQKKRCEVGMDEFTLTAMVNLVAKLGILCGGRQLHSYMVRTGNDRSGFAVSSLIDMYSKCDCFKEAQGVFEACEGVVDLVSRNAMVAACCREGEMNMASRLFWEESKLNDVVSWNTLISGYVQNGYESESLKVFVCMRENGVKWNEHTFASLLCACANLRNLKLGKEIHAWVLKNGLTSNPFINSGVVDVYCKCGNMKYAESIHLDTGIGNTFSIASMIVGYLSQGDMVEARRLFDSLEEKNAIVWTALFSGYVRSRQCEIVFELLREFRATEAMVPDSLILVSVLSACALRAALGPGKQIHGFVFRMGIEMDKKMISAMVDMYSKCGNITYAKSIFEKVKERDSVLYNIMIAGYAHNGHEIGPIQLFQEMLEKGVSPDPVTFVALLSACRHCGLVDLGEKYFSSMTKDYNILPEIDHYACMIDLYGRANQLEKAVAFMKRIPVDRQDATIVGAFLNACRLNKNAELARDAEEKLLKIEGDSGARYVQLANVYAAEGNWAEMQRIRMQMRGKEAKKFAGCSWVYVDNLVHIFTSGDRTHLKAESIYSILACLTTELYGFARQFC